MLKRLPVLIAVTALAIWLGIFIVKNFLATSLIAYGEDEASRNAAASLAPGNPAVIAARGKYLLYRAEPPRTDEAIAELRRAAKLSPYDYRFQLELGRALENAGEATQAENAMQRAVDLAPRYFEPRWSIANLRLRAGKIDQALIDFRKAIELSRAASNEASSRYDEKAVMNILQTVYSATGEDMDILLRITPSEVADQTYLAGFLANQGRIDDALGVFRGLPESREPAYRRSILNLLRVTQEKGRFIEAHEIWKKLLKLENPEGGGSEAGFFNGGFESKPLGENHPALLDSQSGFDWIIRRHSEVRVRRTDLERSSGRYSLHLNFAAPMKSEFQEVSRTILVEPLQTYRLSWRVKTKNVSTLENETPYLEISDPLQPGVFALRASFPAGTNSWADQSLGFIVPEEVRGLRLAIRSPQLTTIDRLRIAELWLDDFKLEARIIQ